jgi:hypothetical protein
VQRQAQGRPATSSRCRNRPPRNAHPLVRSWCILSMASSTLSSTRDSVNSR